MVYEVDQSGKIEQYNMNTTVGISNGTSYSILISKKDKRLIKKIFKSSGKVKRVQYILFSYLIARILSEYELSGTFYVDLEYPGHNIAIYHEVFRHLRNLDYGGECEIQFKQIGKRSNAHKVANDVFRKIEIPDLIVNNDELRRSFRKY